MTQELKLMVGIPASGKSTWIQKQVARIEEEHRTVCVISRDYVRQNMLRPEDSYFAREDAVFTEFVRQVNEAMEIGFDVVIVDATHINLPSRRKLLSRLNPDPHTRLTLEVMVVPLAVALVRNAHRTGFARIPDSAIHKMNRTFRMPTLDEFPANNYGFSEVKIVVHKEEGN